MDVRKVSNRPEKGSVIDYLISLPDVQTRWASTFEASLEDETEEMARAARQNKAQKSQKRASSLAASTKAKGVVERVAKLASYADLPDEAVPMGTGFYRIGHHIWELRTDPDGEGYELIRKREERASDLRRVAQLVVVLPNVTSLGDLADELEGADIESDDDEAEDGLEDNEESLLPAFAEEEFEDDESGESDEPEESAMTMDEFWHGPDIIEDMEDEDSEGDEPEDSEDDEDESGEDGENGSQLVRYDEVFDAGDVMSLDDLMDDLDRASGRELETCKHKLTLPALVESNGHQCPLCGCGHDETEQ